VYLIASLPANNVKLAHAAEQAGADMIKVHINVTHRASGTSFGPWSDERNKIQAILDAVKIPVGIMPGSEVVASPEDWGEMLFAGIEFFDIYVRDMPAWMWRLSVKKMPAISDVYPPSILLNICRGHGSVESGTAMQADWLEASIIDPLDYGKALTALDLANYRWLSECVDIPVIVPTQKKITPDEIPILHDAGAGGIMVGKIVTGDTAESLEHAVSKFRNAIDIL